MTTNNMQHFLKKKQKMKKCSHWSRGKKKGMVSCSECYWWSRFNENREMPTEFVEKSHFSAVEEIMQKPDYTELNSKWKMRKKRHYFLKCFLPLASVTLSWFSKISVCLFFSHLCWVIFNSPLNVEILQKLCHLTLLFLSST